MQKRTESRSWHRHIAAPDDTDGQYGSTLVSDFDGIRTQPKTGNRVQGPRKCFQDVAAQVLYLMATCYYTTDGFTIFFEPSEEDSGKFRLMEWPPSGVFLNLATYYAAVWPMDGVSDPKTLPTHVMIEDARGEHRIRVKPRS